MAVELYGVLGKVRRKLKKEARAREVTSENRIASCSLAIASFQNLSSTSHRLEMEIKVEYRTVPPNDPLIT